MAAGSSAALEKSEEWDHDAEHRQCDDKGHDKNHERSMEHGKKITAIRRARAHTVSMPQGMTVAGCLSMADLLNLVVPLGIPHSKE